MAARPPSPTQIDWARRQKGHPVGLKKFGKKYGKTLKKINRAARPLKQLGVAAVATYANTQAPGSGGTVTALLSKAPKAPSGSTSIAELPEPAPFVSQPPPAPMTSDLPAAGTDWGKITLYGGGALAAVIVLPKLLRGKK